jgi:CheY-like chemotaxis protein
MVARSTPGYYDFVFMDIQMPYMDGYQATKEIRRLNNPELARVPIVAMTANAFDEDRERALECGMNEHIAKPIDVSVLADVLQMLSCK